MSFSNHFFLAIIVCFVSRPVSAQLEWVVSIGGPGVDTGREVVVDDDGNIVVCGRYNNIVDFNPGSGEFIIESSGSNLEFFIVKLSENGDFLWVKSFGSSSGALKGMTSDNEGNILIIGEFFGTSDFSTTGEPHLLSSSAPTTADVFVLKLDSQGNFIEAVSFGGAGNDSVMSLSVDSNNNVYVTGEFYSTVDFNPHPDQFYLLSATSDPEFFPSSDAYLLKLNSNLDFLWANKYGALGGDISNSVMVDSEDNVWLTGKFALSITVEMASGQTDTLWALDPVPASFLMKLNSDGFGLELKMFGSNVASITCLHLSEGNQGHFYIAGSAATGVEIQTAFGTFTTTTGLLLMKANSVGDIQWVKMYGGIPPGPQNGSRTLYSMDVDSQGIVWMTGTYTQSLYFDEVVETITYQGEKDIFLVGIDEEGSFHWSKSFGSTSEDYGRDVVCDAYGRVYLTGSFRGEADFGLDGDPHFRTSNGNSDAFILKLSTDSLDIGLSKPRNQTGISVWPNPFAGLFTIQTPTHLQNAYVAVHDLTGWQVYRARLSGANHTIDLSAVPTGLYILSIGEGPEAQRIKILKE